MKKAHFNPKSVTWLISLAVMIVISAGVIFGTQAIDSLANKKYNEPVEISFTVESTKPVDISAMNADKKRTGSSIKFILLHSIGDAFINEISYGDIPKFFGLE